MKATLVQMIEGQLIPTDYVCADVFDLIPIMEIRGYAFRDLNKNTKHRAELQGAPRFVGLNGPMWNGDGIRYEDAAAYRALSE